MDELIYIISDTEIGRKDIMDDFSDDEQLVDFIVKIGRQEGDPRTTLILNGDIFDFLKMGYKDSYPLSITENISLWKLEEALNAHRSVFLALKDFISNPRHSICFIIGNHDADLAWPALQRGIREELVHGNRIKFDYWYENPDIHVEHGHLFDPFFAINPLKPTIYYKGTQILSLPWGAQASSSHLVKIKSRFPKEEQLYPKPLALEKFPEFKKASRKVKINLAFKKLLIDPLLHFGNPNYKTPYFKFLGHFLRYGTDVLDDKRFIPERFKSLIKTNPGRKIYIMGHSHVLYKGKISGIDCLATDTWRNEYDLTKEGRKKPKSFAEIYMQNGRLDAATLKVL
jgi:UDP-2,3-diacylglucosamine pyrophosphatase LpxH